MRPHEGRRARPPSRQRERGGNPGHKRQPAREPGQEHPIRRYHQCARHHPRQRQRGNPTNVAIAKARRSTTRPTWAGSGPSARRTSPPVSARRRLGRRRRPGSPTRPKERHETSQDAGERAPRPEGNARSSTRNAPQAATLDDVERDAAAEHAGALGGQPDRHRRVQ
jgi:hypothetical protein